MYEVETLRKLVWESYFKLINFVNSRVVFLKCNVLGMAPKSEVFNESVDLKNPYGLVQTMFNKLNALIIKLHPKFQPFFSLAFNPCFTCP